MNVIFEEGVIFAAAVGEGSILQTDSGPLLIRGSDVELRIDGQLVHSVQAFGFKPHRDDPALVQGTITLGRHRAHPRLPDRCYAQFGEQPPNGENLTVEILRPGTLDQVRSYTLNITTWGLSFENDRWIFEGTLV